MMTKMRELSKIFIIIVAVSFIALMVFEWGADMSGRSKVDDVVGSVNDNDLSYSMFTELYQQLYQNYRTQTGKTDFSETELQQLREQVWEQYIQRTLFTEQMEKLGITVSDSEIVYQIYNYPLEELKQHPSFQTEGAFDISKYRASFNNPNIPWNQIEYIYRQQIPFVKLQNIITNTVRVTDDEILDEFKRENLKAKVEYLSVLPSTFNKNLEALEAEISAFYNDNKDDYKQNEMRELSYILFPIETTAQDTARLFEDFEQIKQRLANGDEFSQLAIEYSEDPSVKNNQGDLGYIERGSMLKPFEDAAFGAKAGELVGPIKTSFGYHLIKVDDRKTEDGKEKVKTSHILLKINPSPSTLESQESRARFFSEDAKDMGFIAAAEADSHAVKTTGMFEERSGFIPGIGRNPAIMNFAFSSESNGVSGVYKIDQGYAVFAVTTIQPEGYRDLESVKNLIENRVKLEKAKDKARAFADSLGEDVAAQLPFKQIAEKHENNKVRYDVTSLFTIDANIPRVGKSVEFNATAFTLDSAEVSNLIEADRGFYYQRLLEKTQFDSSAFDSQKDMLNRRLLSQKKNQIFTDWYEDLKEEATIADNRKKFGL